MRIRTNRIYPYPVYSVFSDDYANNCFSAEADIEYGADNATILLDVIIEDNKLREMMEAGQISLYCHMDSPVTKFRDVFKVDLNENYHAEHNYDLQQLNGNIELTCLLITNVEIDDFTDDNLAGLYEGEIVRFPRYATIGYTQTVEIELHKKTDINGEVPSIFKITPTENEEGQMTFDASDEYIYIYLPRNQYDIYMDYKGQSKRLKTMMINLPVLTEIIDSVNSGTGEDYATQPWFDVVEQGLKKFGITEFAKDFTTRSAIEIAQLLLGNITKDAFDEFDKLLNGKDQ